MPRHIWSVLCRKAVIDQETNQLSLQEVIESVVATIIGQPPKNAAIPLEVQLVTFWTRSDFDVPEKSRARFRILAPDDSAIGDGAELEINLSKTPNFRNIVKISGMKDKGSGQYWFIVDSLNDEQDWQEQARVPLMIEIQVQ